MCLGLGRRRRSRPVGYTVSTAHDGLGGKEGGKVVTSPSNRRILKLRLLIFSVGEPGKQFRQFPNEYRMSRKTCAMMAGREGMTTDCRSGDPSTNRSVVGLVPGMAGALFKLGRSFPIWADLAARLN
jgi:hypothetical protein